LRIAPLLSQSDNFTFAYLFSMASQWPGQFFLPLFLSFANPKLPTKRATERAAQVNSKLKNSVAVFDLADLSAALHRLGLFCRGPPVEHHVDDLGRLVRQLGLIGKPRVIERELG
jgi:hypothetical protein